MEIYILGVIVSGIVSTIWGVLVSKYSEHDFNADSFLAPLMFGLLFPPLGLFFLYRLTVIVPNIIKYHKLTEPNFTN
jgi:hypothetical protein